MSSNVCFTGCQLICSGIVNADLTIPCNPLLLITGTVYDPEGCPLPGAAVEVRFLYESDPLKSVRLGVTFTLPDGTYGVTLPRMINGQYQLLAFSSI